MPQLIYATDTSLAGNIQKVRDLLALGIDINSKNGDGSTALQESARNGIEIYIIEYLFLEKRRFNQYY